MVVMVMIMKNGGLLGMVVYRTIQGIELQRTAGLEIQCIRSMLDVLSSLSEYCDLSVSFGRKQI